MARRDHDQSPDDSDSAVDPQGASAPTASDEHSTDRAAWDDESDSGERAFDDASDDDASDDDASDDALITSDPDDPDDPDDPPAPRRSLGPTLLTLGAGVWGIAAALRCGAPEPGPSLSVSPDTASAPAEPDVPDANAPNADDEPSEVEVDPTAPQPASDRPDDIDELDDRGEDDPPLPEPLPEDWATAPSVPTKVAYTIRRGGSIKNVANLFKIFHHEITALNPGVTLEQELPPNSKVVVYVNEDGVSSESVGFPSGGSLEGGVPMVEGPGRVLKMIPWKSYGTAHTVALLDGVLRQWAKRGPNTQPVLVGNMAARKGGRLEPHSTHQSGRDVDISYIQELPAGDELNWREMNANNLDAAETWALLKLLRSTGQVEVIFIDSSIQKLLYDHAVSHGTVPKSQLGRWLQYPKSGGRRALVQHVKGHVDHIHVRFACQPHETRCKSRTR